METIEKIIYWTNYNSGFLSLLLFAFTIVIAWISGLWSLIGNKSKFNIEIIDSCSFGCIIDLNSKHNDLPISKTAFAIYLRITNVGRAASEVGKIRLGYLKSDFTHKFFSRRNWINEISAKDDFRVEFEGSDRVKIFPFLRQKNQYYNNNLDTYLPLGRSAIGIVYFEQNEAFGSWMPRYNRDNRTTNLLIEVTDAFGKKHRKKFNLELVEPDYAFKFNPYFGQTYKEYFIEKESPVANNS